MVIMANPIMTSFTLSIFSAIMPTTGLVHSAAILYTVVTSPAYTADPEIRSAYTGSVFKKNETNKAEPKEAIISRM
jgi:hypothetical protein